MIEAPASVADDSAPVKIPHRECKRYVPLKLRRKIWAMPCAICGIRFRICVDHIVPVTLGGTRDESNLQPLCWLCNSKKGNRLTNDQLSEWFEANRDQHMERVRLRMLAFPEYY